MPEYIHILVADYVYIETSKLPCICCLCAHMYGSGLYLIDVKLTLALVVFPKLTYMCRISYQIIRPIETY
jgi:hypothetical protein